MRRQLLVLMDGGGERRISRRAALDNRAAQMLRLAGPLRSITLPA